MEKIQDVKQSYYEYVSKIGEGCLVIANLLRTGKQQEAFASVADFAEGIEWLLTAEQVLDNQGFTINSRIKEVNGFLSEINDAIENQDIVTVADIFEYEMNSLFSSASEWAFTEK